MSGIRYVVIWRDRETGKDYLPTGNENYEINEQSAKEAGRDLLVALRPSPLIPFGVMPLHPKDQERVAAAKLEVVNYGSPPVEFVELPRA